jgi:hypothetical protein
MAFFYPERENRAFAREGAVTAEEVLDYFDGHVDPSDEAAIREGRGLLYRYANREGLLPQLIERALREGHADNADGFMLTNQSIIVQSRGAYILRLNFWPAPSQNALHHEREQALLSYETPHDHNFSLLTIGCYGPGYRTTVKSYERDQVRGEIGETLPLGEVQDYQLGHNDMLFYSACRDVHSQHVPTSLSVSLNLIAQDIAVYRKSQFTVSFDSGSIIGYPESRIGKYLSLLSLVGDRARDYRSELETIASQSDSEQLRSKAAHLLTQYCADAA